MNTYTQNERVIVLLAITLSVGLLLGFWMQRASQKRRPVWGGRWAAIFHYLAASTFSGVIPTIFLGLASGLDFLHLAFSSLTLMALTWIFLLLYAFFESRVQGVEDKSVILLD